MNYMNKKFYCIRVFLQLVSVLLKHKHEHITNVSSHDDYITILNINPYTYYV